MSTLRRSFAQLRGAVLLNRQLTPLFSRARWLSFFRHSLRRQSRLQVVVLEQYFRLEAVVCIQVVVFVQFGLSERRAHLLVLFVRVCQSIELRESLTLLAQAFQGCLLARKAVLSLDIDAAFDGDRADCQTLD